MIISRVEIRNFRSIKNVDLDCQELTSLLGRNGCGKSSILRAIDVFYNISYQATDYDYFAKDTNTEIRIAITYDELRADEINEYLPYLVDNKLSVAKIINKGGSRYYGTTKQIEFFNQLRQMSAVDKRKALNELIDSGKLEGLGPKVTSNEMANALMDEYERLHPELTKQLDKETQFFGSKNIGGGKLDNYTKFVLIPAVRDALNETEKRGVIHQLIDILVTRSVNAREDVQNLNAEFEARVKEVYSKENLTELTALADQITKLLSQYAPGASLDLDFDEPVPPKINLPNALASLVEDNFSSPINYSGHGVQRALVLALLQQLSLIDSAPIKELSKTEGETAKENIEAPQRPPDLILAIEEPELYLHPSRSRYLAGLLHRLSSKSKDKDAIRTQIMYATHSPYFIDLNEFDRIRIACKVPTDGYPVKQCQITSYSKEEAISTLAKISGKDPGSFTASSFVARITPVMTSIVNEGFFSDVVVIVEGMTEVGILWALQDLMNQDWDAKGISILAAIGKNNIDRPVVIFRGFEIPTYFIFDGDSQNIGKKDEKKSAEKNQYYLKLAGANPEDFPSTQSHSTWAVFNQTLETELRNALGKHFQKVLDEVCEELGYTSGEIVLKNVEGAALFIRKSYAYGLTVPVLESIVNHISQMIKK